MAGDTKERILDAALELFAQRGYVGTSMSDIAAQLGITKAALYKHYAGKQQIIDGIIERLYRDDTERAAEYEMPLGAAGYTGVSAEKIRAYSVAQFRHWTEDGFSSRLRKMLTLEQFRDMGLAQLYQSCLASGPLEYMTAVFREMTNSDAAAKRLALEFYGPMFLLYSVYDAAEEKDEIIKMLEKHVDSFMELVEKERKR